MVDVVVAWLLAFLDSRWVGDAKNKKSSSPLCPPCFVPTEAVRPVQMAGTLMDIGREMAVKNSVNRWMSRTTKKESWSTTHLVRHIFSHHGIGAERWGRQGGWGASARSIMIHLWPRFLLLLAIGWPGGGAAPVPHSLAHMRYVPLECCVGKSQSPLHRPALIRKEPGFAPR